MAKKDRSDTKRVFPYQQFYCLVGFILLEIIILIAVIVVGAYRLFYKLLDRYVDMKH